MKLKSVRSSVPAKMYTAKEIAAEIGAEEAFISDKVGAATRYFLTKDESGTDLSEVACRKLFEQDGLDPASVGLLVVVTQTPDYRIPHNSALLQHRLNLPLTTAAFDISLGCSGYVYALSICKGLMDAQNIENCILVTCDPYSKIMDKTDRGTYAVFGDGATATWLSQSDGADIGLADMGTCGEHGEHLILKNGGAVSPLYSVHDDEVPTFEAADSTLKMKGRGIFNFVLANVPGSIEKCLELNNLSHADIDYYALHQGSFYMLKSLARKAGLSSDKMLYNIQDYGNTVSSSVPMLMETLIVDKKVESGTRVLLSGFGVGLSWATNVVTF